MEMKAISDNYGVEESAALAVRAGVDALLFCHDVANATQAFEFLCHEAERDPELRARVEFSFRRITTLKQRYLKSFTGAAEEEIEARLMRLNHRRLLSANFGIS
jgi:beta-glucosidase-like glycosyl hydrolase